MPIVIPNYGRNQMAELFNELGFRSGVEVGVCDGTYSEILCKANPDAKIYGVDPFIPYADYHDYRRWKTVNGYHQAAIERLSPYKNYSFIEKFSMDAVKDFEDNSLDFVYIDANHNFQNVTNDVIEWNRKLKVGGILAGHDYTKLHQGSDSHVPYVIDAYTAAKGLRPWFVLGNQAKHEGLIRDNPRSWMWVKL
jgi:hypothetical protein